MKKVFRVFGILFLFCLFFVLISIFTDIDDKINGEYKLFKDYEYIDTFQSQIDNSYDSLIINELWNKCKEYDDKEYLSCINIILEDKFEYEGTYTELLKEKDGKWYGDCESYSLTWSYLLEKKGINYTIILLNSHIYVYANLENEDCKLDIGVFECY